MNNNNTTPLVAHANGAPLTVAPAHSSPSSVSGALGGPSSLAELDAVTVITCRTNIYIYIEYSVFVAFRVFYATDICVCRRKKPHAPYST